MIDFINYLTKNDKNHDKIFLKLVIFNLVCCCIAAYIMFGINKIVFLLFVINIPIYLNTIRDMRILMKAKEENQNRIIQYLKDNPELLEINSSVKRKEPGNG